MAVWGGGRGWGGEWRFEVEARFEGMGRFEVVKSCAAPLFVVDILGPTLTLSCFGLSAVPFLSLLGRGGAFFKQKAPCLALFEGFLRSDCDSGEFFQCD